VGGLGRLATALTRAAEEAGAEILRAIEPGDVLLENGRIAGIVLSDGSEIGAPAIISTLDLKRTFLSHFQWNMLPVPVVSRVKAFRMAGGSARVLLALERPPDTLPAELLRGTIHCAPELEQFAEADLAWRTGSIPAAPPAVLRLVSATDPSLAPAGAAVLTVTLGAIPFRLFDSAWTKEKRDGLRDRALAAAEAAMPGTIGRVLAAEVIAPSDMEAALGATEGDLWGGEIAADQMFGFRPWAGASGPRTPMAGLYLAGPSSASGVLGSCAAGFNAARALLADRKAGRYR
jgi:phytoene dehydrogenase-like protein